MTGHNQLFYCLKQNQGAVKLIDYKVAVVWVEVQAKLSLWLISVTDEVSGKGLTSGKLIEFHLEFN